MMMTSGVQVDNHTHNLSSDSAVAIFVPKMNIFLAGKHNKKIALNAALPAKKSNRSNGGRYTYRFFFLVNTGFRLRDAALEVEGLIEVRDIDSAVDMEQLLVVYLSVTKASPHVLHGCVYVFLGVCTEVVCVLMLVWVWCVRKCDVRDQSNGKKRSQEKKDFWGGREYVSGRGAKRKESKKRSDGVFSARNNEGMGADSGMGH